MIWYPFSAKPECTVDPECPDHLACIEEKCKNPCFTSTCGVNAECRVTQHRALCICNPGYVGDPYRICEERKNAFVIFPSHSGIKMKKCVNLLVQEVAWLPQRLKSHIFDISLLLCLWGNNVASSLNGTFSDFSPLVCHHRVLLI